MTEVAKLILITKGRVAADVLAEGRASFKAAADVARKRAELEVIERQAAKLSHELTVAKATIKRPPTRWTAPLVTIAGVAVWAAGSHTPGYETPTKAVALAVALALAVAAASGWRWSPYPRLGFPTFVVVPIALVLAGAVAVGLDAGILAAIAWIVPAAALAYVRLRQSWTAFALGRDQLTYQALKAEVAVLKAGLARLEGRK